MADILRKVIAANRAGRCVSIPSVCSAHPEVLRASLGLAERLDRALVIEATSNQVNQEGGYTGMRPADFIAFVRRLAAEGGTDPDRIVFGGDHLGPQAWRRLPADEAMARAHVMVRDYVRAGFTKIHLDCSEGCAGELPQLDDAVTVPRAADLARSCRAAGGEGVLYVVGTEVPPPGGARSEDHHEIPPTSARAARATCDAHVEAFAGIGEIGALVVQPGVEFSPMSVHHLPLDRDPGLREAVAHHPGIALEAHSTDYQRPQAYVRLAELGFAFQKVGPALTFAYRQAVYALDHLCVLAGWGGGLRGRMEALMLEVPGHWQGHYHGAELALQRHFGFADRIRYYWPLPEAQAAVAALMEDLRGRHLPEPLLMQLFGTEVLDRAEAVRGDAVTRLVHATIEQALAPYFLGDDVG